MCIRDSLLEPSARRGVLVLAAARRDRVARKVPLVERLRPVAAAPRVGGEHDVEIRVARRARNHTFRDPHRLVAAAEADARDEPAEDAAEPVGGGQPRAAPPETAPPARTPAAAPSPAPAPPQARRRARAAGVRFIVLVRNRLRDRPGETRDRRLRVAVGVRRPGGDDLDDDLRARVAHATGEPGIVRDRVSIGLHHDGIFTRVSPGASGGAVLGLSNGVWEF